MVLLIDINDFCAWAMHWEQGSILSRFIAISVIILFVKFYKISFRTIRFNCTSIIFLIFLFFYSIIKAFFPDNACDTLHYHLIAQEPGFYNYLQDNGFARGSFQVWSFRLGDRLYYYSRILLGYKFGTMLYSVVLGIIYIQLVELLRLFKGKLVNGSTKWICKIWRPEIFAGFIVLGHEFLLSIATYYVDILAIPFLLEIVLISLKNIESMQNKYIFLLCGMMIAFKLTNVIFIIPYLLLCFRKYINGIDVNLIIKFLCIVGPCFVYFLHSFLCTGNPIFPAYNSIFKSDFYEYSNLDYSAIGFGGQHILEKICWLFYFVFSPWYRQLEIPPESIQFINVFGFFGIFYGIFSTQCWYRKMSFFTLGIFFYGELQQVILGII